MSSRDKHRRGALTLAIALAALSTGALADAPALPDTTAEVTLAPEASGTPETSGAPETSDTPEASSAPETSDAPEATATPDPGAQPTPAPSALPSSEPTVAPSPAPTAYPTLELGATGEDVLRLQARLVELKYLVYPEGSMPDGIFGEETRDAVMLFQTQLMLEPTGIADDALQQRLFAPDAPAYGDPLPTPMPTFPPDWPGGWPGSFPDGWPQDMIPGMDPMATPGIIPGQPLTSGHSKGDGDMTLYGALPLDGLDGAEDVCELKVDGDIISISLIDAEGEALPFRAEYEDGVLTLTAVQSGTWRVNGYALRVLARSGAQSIALNCGDAHYSLETEQELHGAEYASLRAQGYVSQDFDYMISALGTSVRAAGREFALTGGELMPLESEE